MPIFYHNLKSWRLFKGLTQEEMARRSGISRPNLAALERGRRDCTLSTLHRLSYALEVSPGTLLDQEPPSESSRPLGRHEIDRIARSLMTGNVDLPASWLTVRDRAAYEAEALLRAGGIRRKGRIKKRLPAFKGDEVEKVLERVRRLLPHFLSEEAE